VGKYTWPNFGQKCILTIHPLLLRRKWSGCLKFLVQGVSLRFSTVRNWLHVALINIYQVNGLFNFKTILPSLFDLKCSVRYWNSLNQHSLSKERIAGISWKRVTTAWTYFLSSWIILWSSLKTLEGCRSSHSKTPFVKFLGYSPGWQDKKVSPSTFPIWFFISYIL